MTETNQTVETAEDEESWGEWFNRVYNTTAAHIEVAVDALFGGPNAEACVAKNKAERFAFEQRKADREAALKAEKARHDEALNRINEPGEHTVKEPITVGSTTA